VLNSAERQALGLAISALNDAVRDAIDDAHHALSRTQFELVDADSYFTGHGAARAAGALIEFERGRPIIVDRPLYHELVTTAIKRTHDELEAKTAAAAKDKKTRPLAQQPAGPVTRQDDHRQRSAARSAARQGPRRTMGASRPIRRPARHLQNRNPERLQRFPPPMLASPNRHLRPGVALFETLAVSAQYGTAWAPRAADDVSGSSPAAPRRVIGASVGAAVAMRSPSSCEQIAEATGMDVQEGDSVPKTEPHR
jgi:hypothetical protein